MHGGDSDHAAVVEMVSETWRVLELGGLFIVVSHNGMRLALLDHALSVCQVPDACWEPLEIRRVGLSPQATLINILRSKLKGQPISVAFKDPAMMAEAAKETREAMKQMAFLEAFRLFKARKMRAQTAVNSLAGETGKPSIRKEMEQQEEEEDTDTPRDPRLQPFCWVYVLKKCRNS